MQGRAIKLLTFFNYEEFTNLLHLERESESRFNSDENFFFISKLELKDIFFINISRLHTVNVNFTNLSICAFGSCRQKIHTVYSKTRNSNEPSMVVVTSP